MKVPLSWLKEYVDITLAPKDLAHRLTMGGVEVGEVAQIGGWQNCFVGQVLETRPHPNADRLRLCQVTTGAGALEVVCGAPNVAAGQKVCFAREGAFLFNTHSGKHEALKASRIRGVVSQGMICSARELGLGDDHDGIIVLPDDAPLGKNLDDYLGDVILDLELTPNRGDCLAILGVAREVGALTGQPVREPAIAYPEAGAPIAGQVTVSLADPDLCHRYTAALVRNVKVGPSPRWMQERLTRAGLRPINNIVDVTNYVMLEYGQPLHAFDYDKLRDHTIIVRRARPGEKLRTLADPEEKALHPDTLVIADSRDPVGVGGVVGGANSEIGPATVNVLLEAATFDALNNRATAQRLRLRTDATQRFEKGLRPELAPIGLRRAAQLFCQVAGGEVAQGIIDIYPGHWAPAPVTLTLARLNQVLGMDYDLALAEKTLASLGFAITERTPESLTVPLPYWRSDIAIEEDLIEEVVRIVGYDTVPTVALARPIPHYQAMPIIELRERARDILVAAGMQEAINYPTVSQEDLARAGLWDAANPPLRLTNPLNTAQPYLRPNLRISLLRTLEANQGQGDGPFQFFEAGRGFLRRPNDLPEERELLAGILMGRRWEHSWLLDNSNAAFYDAKGAVETLLARLGVAASFEPVAEPFFYPGRCARVSANGQTLGLLGELRPVIRERFDLKALPVACFELDLAALLDARPASQRRFRSLSRYPAALRDLALVVSAEVPAAKVQELLERPRLVERVELFDMYSGANLPPGTRSLAYRLHFQAADRTLTTEEVNRAVEGLLRNLEREIGATLRS